MKGPNWKGSKSLACGQQDPSCLCLNSPQSISRKRTFNVEGEERGPSKRRYDSHARGEGFRPD